ncbi:MAG TPA: hypothetical protein VJ997_08160 [Longimicrobiales bacterium]|nr:hypothetical protein [Longimicrobiales bacterium]
MKKLIFAMVATLLTAAPASAQNPYMQGDETWITLNGTVRAVTPNSFTLDYSDGVVTVEMDDWDHDADALNLIAGDDVIVTGKVDDDLFETTTVEASSVYVKGLNKYFYASAADEEDAVATLSPPLEGPTVTMQGTVTSVDGRDFMMQAGSRTVRVATDMMSYNPLDDLGYQRVDVGDRVSVTGTMDYEFWDGRELTADLLITLDDRAMDR